MADDKDTFWDSVVYPYKRVMVSNILCSDLIDIPYTPTVQTGKTFPPNGRDKKHLASDCIFEGLE